MIDKEIIGGVSPLKARRQSSRGGKYAAKATSTSKKRGGFAQSTGKRGAGGRNVGGYNVQTRFKVGAWSPPGSGGTSTTKPPKVPGIPPPEIPPPLIPPPVTDEPKIEKGREERLTPGEKGSSTNEFADNCLGANGEQLTGTTYYSEIKKMEIACEWDANAKDDGSFDKTTSGTKDKNEQRTWIKDKTGKITYSSWEEFDKETK